MWLHNCDVTNDELFNGHLGLVSVAANNRRCRCEFCERLDRSTCPAHRIALEGMAQTEQRQQQRTLFPLSENRGAARGDEHQEIDLEPLVPNPVDRFTRREVATEQPRRDEDGDQHRFVEPPCDVRDEPCDPQHRRRNRKDQFAALTEGPAVNVFPSGVVMTVVSMVVVPVVGFDAEPGKL